MSDRGAPHGEDIGSSPRVSVRMTQVFLAAVVGLAFIGYVVGMRHGVPAYDAPALAAEGDTVEARGGAAAVSYAEFDRRRYGPNRAWRSALSDLAQPEVDLFAPVAGVDESERGALIAMRASRRAYEGAPPVVPHPIDQMTSTGCMACHGEGLFIGVVRAPRMSHEFMTNCTQCHVEQWSSGLAQAPGVATTFVGLESPGRGPRAWEGAPPVIPHPTFMRENCMSCHGPTGPEPIRTSHPWQTNCMQCHAPSATLDQGIVVNSPAFLLPLPVDSR